MGANEGKAELRRVSLRDAENKGNGGDGIVEGYEYSRYVEFVIFSVLPTDRRNVP